MYRIIKSFSRGHSDVETFVETINNDHHAHELFDPSRDIVVTRAPGRLDVMGGIADYSGSMVLQLPIKEAALVAFQRHPTRELRIVSLGAGENDRNPVFEMSLSEFERHGRAIDYATAQAYFKRNPDQSWAAYVAGAFLVLMNELKVDFAQGAHILISSQVPEGKGVSSSAALEVAVMQAICGAFGITLEPREIALLCQKVENLVVGAPCGIMDQMTAVCGETNRLLALLCQPAELKGTIDIPGELCFWGIDSGVRHFVSGSDYSSVRVGAFMGYRMIADLAGLTAKKGTSDGIVFVSDPKWGGYLANISVSEFENAYSACLPEMILGSEFLAKYGGTTDSVTQVDAKRTYAVRTPTAHPIYEHLRVRTFAELLRGKLGSGEEESLGELMYQSHASYSACSLGSTATDRLVNLVRAAGPVKGLYGAKISGGGSGGTVAVLGRHDAGHVIEEIAEQYARETGYRPYLFKNSSPGAAMFGSLRLRSI
jgi:L-arabinokinase